MNNCCDLTLNLKTQEKVIKQKLENCRETWGEGKNRSVHILGLINDNGVFSAHISVKRIRVILLWSNGKKDEL